MSYNYSKDAEILISSLKGFEREKFETWYKEKNIFITIQEYMQFIVYMNDENIKNDLKEKIKDIAIDTGIQFQSNLIPVIENSKIDIDELKRFFVFCRNNIGSSSIVNFLNNK